MDYKYLRQMDKSFSSEGKKRVISSRREMVQFFARYDSYLSIKSAADGVPARRLVMQHFKGAERSYFLKALRSGYLERGGAVADPASFTLRYPDLKVHYRWIPKNSCTAIKTGLASFEDPDMLAKVKKGWVHRSMQDAFGATGVQAFGSEGERKIAIIRDPLERIVSCYLDKFAWPLARGRGYEKFALTHLERAQEMLGIDRSPDRSISFSEFVWYMVNTPIHSWNAHWLPQSAFFGDDVSSYELFTIGRTDQVWTALGLAHDNVRVNPSAGGGMGAGGLETDLSEVLPSDFGESSTKNYANFLPPVVRRFLEPYFAADAELYSQALAQTRGRD